MLRVLKFCFVLFCALFLCVAPSFALTLSDLGKEVTVHDGQVDSKHGYGVWAGNPLGIAGEDNETEGNPNTLSYQSWDLEGMFWNDDTETLFIVGGFDYLNGNHGVSVGDLFVGNGSGGYNYVFDFDRNGEDNLVENGTFNVIGGGDDFTDEELIDPTWVGASTPYAYGGEGAAISAGTYSVSEFDLGLFAGWMDYDNQFLDQHYVLAITGSDVLASLVDAGYIFHLTLECGNDTIHGVPEPATILLFGTGLLGLAGLARKRSIG